MPICTVGQRDIYYERALPEEGLGPSAPALLFVHGMGGAIESWVGMRPYFRNYDCLYVDLPGHGRSPGDPLSVSDNADMVAGLLGKVGLDRVVCLGISYGTAVCLTLAVRHPNRVSALVLMSPRAQFRVSADELEQLIASVANGAFVRRGAGSRTSETMIAGMQRGMESTAPETIRGLFERYNGYDVRADLSRVQAPTLVLSGREDGVSNPADAQLLAERLANAELVELDTGHFIPIEAPRAAALAVKAFLRHLER
ncbi:MAG: alpha/beta hydrolase [Alicyclobacillus sp.]|nr:alpha/beta hydrolase [Alicyclobacillus sp.]